MLDQELIEAFTENKDPLAFRAIVERHGPAVLRTCQRMLADKHEAEDAFQATFLILVKRSPQLRDPELLGPWLVGVARKVAHRSRSKGIQQSARERRWASMQPTTLEQDGTLLEIRRAVREEVEKLPPKYRVPLGLCYLEGLTHEEAAQKLDCPLGTVKIQLVRARKLLKERLDRRGVALSLAFLLFSLKNEASAAMSYPLLADSTVEVMTMASTGGALAVQGLYPAAFALSRACVAPAFLGFKAARFVLLLALLGATMGGMALAQHAKVLRANASAASAKLAKLLDKDCR